MITPIPTTLARLLDSKTVSSRTARSVHSGLRRHRRMRLEPPFPRKVLFEHSSAVAPLGGPRLGRSSEFANYSSLYEDAQSALSALGVSAESPRVVSLSGAAADTLVATNRDNTWEIVVPMK